MSVSRRQFCGMGLVTPIAGFGGRRPKNKRARHRDIRVYHGVIQLPDDVYDIAVQSKVVKTTSRHLAVRVSYGGIVYLMRVVCGRHYLGEVVRTQSGTYRVHLWSAVGKGGRPVAEIVAEIIEAENET